MKKIAVISALVFAHPAWADGMNFNFSNPSFNGGPGWSDHVMRLETTEKQRLQAKKLINKFLENVNSRIYATLSKKLVDAMFADGGASSGTVTLDGTTVQYTKTDDEVILIITDPDGTVTNVTIPIGGFNF
jgi:hypothetical protein